MLPHSAAWPTWKAVGLAPAAGTLRQPRHRLKAAYFKTFYNPATGWLAWWRSADGQLHDLASPMINSQAVCYGLVEPAQSAGIMGRLWSKIEAVGFRGLDLGVPITLVPVRRGDYLRATSTARPSARTARTPSAGIATADAWSSMRFISLPALHTVGEDEKADRYLPSCWRAQEKGVFSNGGEFFRTGSSTLTRRGPNSTPGMEERAVTKAT